MSGLGIYLVGATLLLLAGVLKALRPADTARALAEARPGTDPRRWPPVVRLVATVEAALGAVALVRPDRPVAAAVALSYAAFALWVLWARAHGGSLSSCGCFATPDTPPTLTHAALNAVVAVAATAVAVAGPSGSVLTVLSGQYLDGVPLVVASAVLAWLSYLVMVPLARLGALRAAQSWVPGGRVVS